METLVLDVGYQPTQRVSWQTAIVWVLDKVVEVVDEYPDKYIRTPSWSVKMPSVVRFLRYVKRRNAVKFSRHNILSRDGGRCQYCGRKVGREWGYDHVIPRSQGGRTEWTNIVTSCTPCNQRKGGRTPEQAGMQVLSLPVRPKKLPNMPQYMAFQSGMPESWKPWLEMVRDAVYWEGTLEEG